MFYLFLWGSLTLIFLILGIKIYQWVYRKIKKKYGYHYIILVKNGQRIIEWIIRSIYFDNWIHGKSKKITVIDLGSSDDTLLILERLTYKASRIDELYTDLDNTIRTIGQIVNESENNGEETIILYINSQEESPVIKNIDDLALLKGEIS